MNLDLDLNVLGCCGKGGGGGDSRDKEQHEKRDVNKAKVWIEEEFGRGSDGKWHDRGGVEIWFHNQLKRCSLGDFTRDHWELWPSADCHHMEAANYAKSDLTESGGLWKHSDHTPGCISANDQWYHRVSFIPVMFGLLFYVLWPLRYSLDNSLLINRVLYPWIYVVRYDFSQNSHEECSLFFMLEVLLCGAVSTLQHLQKLYYGGT